MLARRLQSTWCRLNFLPFFALLAENGKKPCGFGQWAPNDKRFLFYILSYCHYQWMTLYSTLQISFSASRWLHPRVIHIKGAPVLSGDSTLHVPHIGCRCCLAFNEPRLRIPIPFPFWKLRAKSRNCPCLFPWYVWGTICPFLGPLTKSRAKEILPHDGSTPDRRMLPHTKASSFQLPTRPIKSRLLDLHFQRHKYKKWISEASGHTTLLRPKMK